jgi:hypothetical protein
VEVRCSTVSGREPLRRWLHRAITIACAVVLSAPLLLGPGAGALLRALGGADVHRCACGMKAGTCGCPECERLEHAHQLEAEALREHPVLKSSCDTNDVAPGSFDVPVAAPPFLSKLPAAPRELRPVIDNAQPDPSLERARPPTPPPRTANA